MLVETIGNYTIRKLSYTPRGFNETERYQWIEIECLPKLFIAYIRYDHYPTDYYFDGYYYEKENHQYLGLYTAAKLPIEIHEAVFKMAKQMINIAKGKPASYVEPDED